MKGLNVRTASTREAATAGINVHTTFGGDISHRISISVGRLMSHVKPFKRSRLFLQLGMEVILLALPVFRPEKEL